MPLYDITYRPELNRPPEEVPADTCAVEGAAGWLVFRQVVVVMSQPREIVVRRIKGEDVLDVTEPEC